MLYDTVIMPIKKMCLIKSIVHNIYNLQENTDKIFVFPSLAPKYSATLFYVFILRKLFIIF